MMYKIYGKEDCVFCIKARTLFQLRGLDFIYVDIEDESEESKEAIKLFKENGWTKVPQIFIGDEHIGGFTELSKKI